MTRVASASALLQRGMRIFRTCWLACLIVGVCLVILIGSVLGWITYRQQRNHMEAQFQRRAVQHTRGINPQKVEALAGSLEDIDSPIYQRIKRHLTIIRQSEDQCRFTYLMRQLDDGTVIILADSEPPESDDYSPPGDVYYEAGEDEEALFAHGQPRVFPPEADRWGKWVSVYAPIRDPYTAEVIALFGMDVDVADWQAALYRQLLPAFVSALLLLVGVAIFCWALRSQERGGNRLANMLVRYGEFIAIGCFGLLLTGYTAWLRHGHEGHRIMTSFAQIADRDLSRVQQRLEHVRDFSLQDLDWYVSNQSEFDRQQFNDWVTARLERPSLHSWGWVGVVPDSHRQDFEDSHAGILPPIWELDADGLPRPATRRPVHYPLMAAKPFELIGEALGYDLGSEPRRRAAIEEAIFTRLTTASQPVDLAIKAPEREALLILHPVFSAADSDDLLGLIVTPLAVPNLVRQVWEGQSSHYSFSSVSEDTPPILLYNTCPRAEHPLDDIGLVRYIGIFGQVLKLETHPGPLFYESHRRYAASRTLFIGFITTAALAILVGAPLHQRRLLEVLVNERTTELQNSQQQYDMLIAHSRAFRWEVDHTGLYTYVSDNVAEIIGFTPQDLVGKKTFYDLAPLEYREEVKQHGLDNMQANQFDEGSENQLVSKEGQVKWVRTTAIPKLNEHGVVTGAFGWDTDITDLKQAEAERESLERERARLATAIDQTRDSVVITDAEGIIEYVNPAFERITGFSAAEAIGRNPRILKSGRQDPAIYEIMWNTIKAGQIWSGRLVNLHKNGYFFTEDVTISPVRDAQGVITHFIAIKRDVTRELEREDMYLQAQKMESFGRLAGGMAHDFNNMLQVILGNTELAMENAGDNAPLQQDLNEIKSAVMRSLELTRQLLAFARRQTVNPKIIDLHKTVPESIQLLERLLEASISLEWQPCDGNACIKVDPTQLDQVLVNLCVNARDAIDGHGAIVLTTWETVLTGDERLAGEQPNPGDYVVLSVRDTGCGMDPDLLEKIFEPFFTTKPRGKGTGLGLSTVYGIVKQNGGYMEVSSAPGTGTKFNLYFPSCEQAEVDVRDDPEQIPVRYDAGILVVDDEVDILRIAERTLSKRGYRVWIADSPRRALEIIQGCGEEIDLLLTDIVMPEMNGRELAEQAIGLNPQLTYLFMSGYSDQIISQDKMNSRETKVLSKPFTANELLAAVIAALQRV